MKNINNKTLFIINEILSGIGFIGINILILFFPSWFLPFIEWVNSFF